MNCHQAAGYITKPPEFHTHFFARFLVCSGASRAVATSQGLLHALAQLTTKPLGLQQENGTQSLVCVWAQVLMHMNPFVDFHGSAVWVYWVLAVHCLLAHRLRY